MVDGPAMLIPALRSPETYGNYRTYGTYGTREPYEAYEPVPPATEPAWTDPAPSRSVVWAGRVALLLAAAGVAWLQPGGWLAVVAALLTLALARAAGWQGRQARIVALAVAVYLAAVDYLSWRLSVLSWVGWWIGVPLFLAALHAALHSVGLHVTLWPQRVDPLWSDLDRLLLREFMCWPWESNNPEVHAVWERLTHPDNLAALEE